MIIDTTPISGLLIIAPHVYTDDRGFFFESYNQRHFEEAIGQPVNFVQDNHSISTRGVLRGLHYQLPPMAQGKLVRVVQGEVYDVAVDLREGSATFGQWFGEILSAENRKQMWLPEGFAHGFLTLSETSEFLYKTTQFYSPEYERSLRWNDPHLQIDWPLKSTPRLSSKDADSPFFKDL